MAIPQAATGARPRPSTPTSPARASTAQAVTEAALWACPAGADSVTSVAGRRTAVAEAAGMRRRPDTRREEEEAVHPASTTGAWAGEVVATAVHPKGLRSLLAGGRAAVGTAARTRAGEAEAEAEATPRAALAAASAAAGVTMVVE